MKPRAYLKKKHYAFANNLFIYFSYNMIFLIN